MGLRIDTSIYERIRTSEDEKLDLTLRPKTLEEFIGQKNLKENLRVFIDAAKKRKESLDHILFYGPQGLGKTTLAHIIANELGVDIKTTSGPVLERPVDLVGILTNLKEGDVLFVDEIHRTSRTVEEYLYSALEDFCIDILIDKGPGARTEKINIAKFTLIGATTRFGMLTPPLRARFGIILHIDYYSPEELELVVKRSAKILGIKITDKASKEIAKRARGTPRIANRLLRRIRDFAEVDGKDEIELDTVLYALEKLGINEYGLDKRDEELLKLIAEKFKGGPVGIKTIAAAMEEDPKTIEEVYEPYLVKMGFLKRTARGRIITEKGLEAINLLPKRIL